MIRQRAAAVLGVCALLATACSSAPTERPMALTAAPTAPLTIEVVYPPLERRGARVRQGEILQTDPAYRIGSTDSTFLFGSVGPGLARLAVNGREVYVHSSGGWLAWVPVPPDSLATFLIVATSGTDTARAAVQAPLASPPGRDPLGDAWIDPTSLSPTGDWWVRPGEGFALRVRAAGRDVRLLTPAGDTISLLPSSRRADHNWGRVAFETNEDGRPLLSGQSERYEAWWVGAFGPDPGHPLRLSDVSEDADSSWMIVEAVGAYETMRVRWPLRVGVIDPAAPVVGVVDDDTAGTGATDSILPGRPSPNGTYHWFFPTGTRSEITGRRSGQVRFQLSERSAAWVDAADVQPLADGTPPPRGRALAPRLFSGGESVTLRIPVTERVPFRVEEEQHQLRVRLYGASADMDWIQYGGTDPFVELLSFDQPSEHEAVVTVDLAQPVWGYRTRWRGNDLMLEIRRPPVVDPDRPLEGRHVALDPGHPPGGATGPTGVQEHEVTLSIARRAARMLEERGASVTLLRTNQAPVGLIERTARAEQVGAEVLVSVHANALPDGVNPFENAGTSVYYYHPRAAPLARAMNDALVERLGVRDLGFGRGDLALARPTWMPSVLTEGLFIMLPDQEAMLVSEEGQTRYARGIVEGLARFLTDYARSIRP
jgi:N-acetylmuramoyl-L-alanine amidase